MQLIKNLCHFQAFGVKCIFACQNTRDRWQDLINPCVDFLRARPSMTKSMMTLDCPHLSERFSVPLLTLSVWAFYRFEKLFFLSPIDSSCLVSFLFMWTISVFMWGMGGSRWCCQMTSWIIPWGQWSAGNKFHLGCSETSWGRIMWNRVLGSTCGISFFCFCGCVYCWEVYFF